MREFDLGDRWIYRNEADGKYHGVTNEALAEKTIAEADVLVNVSGACWLRPATAGIKTKLFLDGDPMFTHIRLTYGEPAYLDRLERTSDTLRLAQHRKAGARFAPAGLAAHGN
jgi:hypothetical protein